MKFGYQLGSGAVAQRDAFAASGKLNLLRFPLVPDATGTGFDQSQTIGSLEYCQYYKLIPHVTLFDAARNYPADKSAYVELFLNFAYNMGVTEMNLEVGNEPDGQPNTGDSVFLSYRDLYAKCSDALKRFHHKRPYAPANYQLGGAASTSGSWFTCRVLSWVKHEGHLMHFASWHHYGIDYSTQELQDQIDAVKGIAPAMPIYLTEVWYDWSGKLNETKDAEDWAKQFKPSVDAVIWLNACPGIWKPDGTLSAIGKVITT